jgi:hypothetical protein
MKRLLRTAPFAVSLLYIVGWAQGLYPAAVARVIADPKFKTAMSILDRDHERLVAEIIRLTESPSPPFGEAARGKVFADMLRAAGLTDVSTDAEGNVIGVRKGMAAPASRDRRAPRHRVSRRHRREGEARRHATRRARRRRRHPRARGAARHRPRDEGS